MTDHDRPQLDLENKERQQSDVSSSNHVLASLIPLLPKYNTDGDDDSVSEQLEVTFGSTNGRRRKSSLNLSKQSRPGTTRQRTSCFVHGLLQDDRLHGDQTPHEELHASKQEKPADKVAHETPGSRTDSRLLSKRELSDMAFSIRELSKRLSRFKLKLKVKHVFLLTKAHDEELIGLTRKVADWLLGHQGDEAYTV